MKLTELFNDEPYMPPNYIRLIKEYHKNRKFIFRGIARDNTKYFVTDGSKMNRVSDGASVLNALTEVLPSWNGWPARTKSFSCTNNYLVADGYSGGNVFMVIPLENQPIAVCKYDDFWQANLHINKVLANYGESDSVRMGYSSASQFFKTLIRDYGVLYSNNFNGVQTLNAMKELYAVIFKDFEQVLNSVSKFSTRYRILETFSKAKNVNEFINILSEATDPEKNGSTLYPNINSATIPISRNPPTSNEIWMSGKVMFVSMSEYYRVNKIPQNQLYNGNDK